MQHLDIAQCHESLANAVSCNSTSNYAAILDGFTSRGIPAEIVIPRENVFTFNAWIALGRKVRDGEQGVGIVIFVKRKGKAAAGTPGRVDARGLYPIRTQVFHISQTEAIRPNAAIH